jgi:2,3-dihydroxybiphenyl 1,2-dioxygenase
MLLQSLGYVGVETTRLDEWRAFGPRIMGLEVADATTSSLAFRMDDRKQRILVDQGSADGAVFYGWEVADGDALERLAARLDRAGVRVEAMSRAAADRRQVGRGLCFLDPSGNRHEAFCDPALADRAFRPGRAMSGFRTGPLGMGHVVLMAQRIEDLLPFYVDVLEFRLSDYMLHPFKAYFFHTNARHHSLALAETGIDRRLHHLMVETYSLDDVGQGLDLADADDCVSVSLGRHSNDLMTSFYARTPSGFMVEYGWGGRDIAPDAWQPVELRDGPSLWGHERAWLPPEGRARALAMRLDAAARGVRGPVQVLPGNHHVMEGACPWWDALRR